jgi:transcriptional regulator with XRE-family HTH domain
MPSRDDISDSPGLFLRAGRVSTGLSIEDLALRLETVPHISAHDRAEWLAMVEADRAPVTIDVGLALCELLDLSFLTLVDLIAASAPVPAGLAA